MRAPLIPRFWRTGMGPTCTITALAGLRNDTSGREQLAKSEAQLLQIIDAIPQMITVLTPANREAMHCSGLPPNQIHRLEIPREHGGTKQVLR